MCNYVKGRQNTNSTISTFVSADCAENKCSFTAVLIGKAAIFLGATMFMGTFTVQEQLF